LVTTRSGTAKPVPRILECGMSYLDRAISP
jgi:hypothetical protein